MLRVIKPGDKERACLFGAQVFCAHEPMCKALGATVADFVEQFSPVVEACCSSGLSYMLEGQQQDAILSMSLALPHVQYKALQMDDHPTFRPVMAMFDALEELPPGRSETAAVNQFMIATHSDHMNKGYAKRVMEGTVGAARQAGYSCMVSDVTNVVSQHLLLTHFGYQPLKKVRYHDYDCFQSIQDTEFIIRAFKPLPSAAAEEQQSAAEQPLE